MTLTPKIAIAVIVSFALCSLGSAQSRRMQVSQPPSGVAGGAQIKKQLNSWTISLAGGLLKGAPIRLATDIASVVNDGRVMHVLPIVTRGPTESVDDLLYLKGMDAAINNSDSLEEYKSQVPQIQQRIARGRIAIDRPSPFSMRLPGIVARRNWIFCRGCAARI